MSLYYPVKKVHITQGWGKNPDIYARFGLKGHNGLDFRAFLPNGERAYSGGVSEVFAPHDGVVIENWHDAGGYGWLVKIENEKEGSILSHFSHQSPLKVGQRVRAGDFIGYQGTTGFSTAIHLHWGYYPKPRDKSNGYSGTIDQAKLPLKMLSEIGSMNYQEEYDKARISRDNWWNLMKSLCESVGVTDLTDKNAPEKVKEALKKIKKLQEDLKKVNEEYKNLKENPKVIVEKIPVEIIKEVPVEVIKEVTKETVKEVPVPSENFGALELISLVLKAILVNKW